MFQAAAPLIDKITSPSILVMVAKAKEAEKQNAANLKVSADLLKLIEKGINGG